MSDKLAFSAALSVLLTAGSLLLGTAPAELPFGAGAGRPAVQISVSGSARTAVDAMFGLLP